jgi:hypothetical protein
MQTANGADCLARITAVQAAKERQALFPGICQVVLSETVMLVLHCVSFPPCAIKSNLVETHRLHHAVHRAGNT